MASTAYELGRSGRFVLRVAALSLLGAALWTLVGPGWAVVLAGVVGVVWTVARTVYAFAVGQLLFAVLVASGLEGPLLTVNVTGSDFVVLALFVGAAVFGVLFVAEAAMRWPPATAGLAVGTFLPAWGVLSSAWQVEPPWYGAAALLLAFALLLYGVHRVELLTLGLLEEVES